MIEGTKQKKQTIYARNGKKKKFNEGQRLTPPLHDTEQRREMKCSEEKKANNNFYCRYCCQLYTLDFLFLSLTSRFVLCDMHAYRISRVCAFHFFFSSPPITATSPSSASSLWLSIFMYATNPRILFDVSVLFCIPLLCNDLYGNQFALPKKRKQQTLFHSLRKIVS